MRLKSTAAKRARELVAGSVSEAFKGGKDKMPVWLKKKIKAKEPAKK